MRDSGEFDGFYLATAPRLVSQVYLMTGDLGAAEDAVQEAYARAWQHWSRVGRYDEPTAWVRRVAYRLAVSNWRRARVRLAAQLRAGPAPDVPPMDPNAVALATALRTLPERQRRAIVLHHLIGLPVREIAAETGMSQSAVKANLSRGRQALAPLLAVEEPTEVNGHA